MNGHTNPPPPKKPARDPRNGLRTSATLATVFTLIGHAFLGFEQTHLQVVVALLTGYVCAIAFEWIDAAANNRPPGWTGGGPLHFVDFLLSAHMTSITLAFLLYVQDRLAVLVFAVVLAIGSKYLFRVKVGGRYRHFMNPSNMALAIVLPLFPTTGAIPWGYTVNVHNVIDVGIPLFIIFMGTRLNVLYTKRVPLIAAWLGMFGLQAMIRSFAFGTPLHAELVALTGIAYLLFTFYMITDPMTSPSSVRGQVMFGAGIGVAYGLLMTWDQTYAMFFAVTIVAAIRGAWMYYQSVVTNEQAFMPLATVAAAK